jgi:hypothetical protein
VERNQSIAWCHALDLLPRRWHAPGVHKISKAIVDRVLATCEASRGSVSVLRALAARGVPEKVGGRWVGEGRDALGRGEHPDLGACASVGCEETLDLMKAGARGRLAAGQRPECPGCGGREWRVPTADAVLKMRLALADTRVGSNLLEEAGRALGEVLADKEACNAGHRLKAAIHVRQSLDPERFGDRRTVKHEGSIGLRAEQSWAGGLRQEQVDSLSPAAVEQLREIASLQRLLDEQARAVVNADLEGKVHRVALPILTVSTS